jgi:hypothetical protein
MGITTTHYQEFKKSVPPVIERPKKQYISYKPEKIPFCFI